MASFAGDGGGSDDGGAGWVGGGVAEAGYAAGGEVSAEADDRRYADWGEAEPGGGGDCGCGFGAGQRGSECGDAGGGFERGAEAAFAGTLGEARMRLFHPLGFMLASPVESPEGAVERLDGKLPVDGRRRNNDDSSQIPA